MRNVDYFAYDHMPPDSRQTPSAVQVALTPSSRNAGNRQMWVDIKGYETDRGAAPDANLVFAIDTSFSEIALAMPLLINSLNLRFGVSAPQDAGATLPPRARYWRRPAMPGGAETVRWSSASPSSHDDAAVRIILSLCLRQQTTIAPQSHPRETLWPRACFK